MAASTATMDSLARAALLHVNVKVDVGSNPSTTALAALPVAVQALLTVELQAIVLVVHFVEVETWVDS
jgi:hypothetical protein